VTPRTANPIRTVRSGADFIVSPAISAAAKATVSAAISGLFMRRCNGWSASISPRRRRCRKHGERRDAALPGHKADQEGTQHF
jgi:hypothetical protein